MGKAGSRARAADAALRTFALGYPEALEEFPWGERAIKVRKKVFVFMSLVGGALSISTKLPRSAPAALMTPFAEPTHYGLGKSGWVTARFAPAETPPLGLLRDWIDESYRAIAPKTLIARLPDQGPAGSRRRAAAPSGAKRTPRRKRARG